MLGPLRRDRDLIEARVQRDAKVGGDLLDAARVRDLRELHRGWQGPRLPSPPPFGVQIRGTERDRPRKGGWGVVTLER